MCADHRPLDEFMEIEGANIEWKAWGGLRMYFIKNNVWRRVNCLIYAFAIQALLCGCSCLSNSRGSNAYDGEYVLDSRAVSRLLVTSADDYTPIYKYLSGYYLHLNFYHDSDDQFARLAKLEADCISSLKKDKRSAWFEGEYSEHKELSQAEVWRLLHVEAPRLDYFRRNEELVSLLRRRCDVGPAIVELEDKISAVLGRDWRGLVEPSLSDRILDPAPASYRERLNNRRIIEANPNIFIGTGD